MMYKDNSEWIIVKSKNKRRRQKKRTDDKKKITLTDLQIQELDELSRAIYVVLTRYDKLIPASFITKQVNNDTQQTYTKQEIGHLLYEGPLHPFLFCYKRKTPPTLWGLKYKHIYLQDHDFKS